MRRLWLTSVMVALAWIVGGASAQEVTWRPARRPASASAPAQPAPSSAVASGIQQAAFQTQDSLDTTRSARVPTLETPVARTRDIIPRARRDADVESAFATEASPGLMPAVLPNITTASPASVLTFERAPVVTPDAGCYACGAGGGCDPGGRFFLAAEYLGWEIREQHLPILLTTSPIASQGRLGQPGTVPVFGGRDLSEELRSGLRLSAGYWFDPCQEWAVDGNIFGLAPRHTRFAASSDEFGLLARPFFNLNQGIQDSQVSTQPSFEVGAVTITTASRLWGTEINLRRNICCDCGHRFDLFAGFRYLDLEEKLDINESILALPAFTGFAGDRILVDDHFGTRNQFFGGQLGAESAYRWGPWTLDVRAKIGIGDSHESVDIHGSQQVTTPAGVTTMFNGGLLALRSNSGHFTRDHFAVVPEVSINLGYQFTEHLRGFVGYNFLYWSNVLRPGDQIDQSIDVSQIPNFRPGVTPVALNRPAVPFKETSFWAQGANVGLEIRY